MEQFKQQMEQARALVEERLAEFFPGDGLQEAMRYSLLAGGKRIRPILAMKFCEAAGGDPEDALDFGCGVEMLHTYSLIHEDLPCMDDDDLRRGKPTCHKVYGECIATLAGDALQAAAFETVLFARGLWIGDAKSIPALAAGVLATSVGEKGMCGGQYLDVTRSEADRTVQELTDINSKKTSALLRAACMMGVLAASAQGRVDNSCMDAAKDYAAYLGLAFQIRDDMLDVMGSAEEFGKPIGSDASNEKATYVTLLGLEECQRRVGILTERAKAALDGANWQGDPTFLKKLADALSQRKK